MNAVRLFTKEEAGDIAHHWCPTLRQFLHRLDLFDLEL